MNSLLFMLCNAAVGLVMVWAVRNDRRKGDETDGVFAVKRAGAEPVSASAPAAPPPRRRQR